MGPVIFTIPLWAELVAAGLGGLQGALFAARFRERRIDVLGVVTIGIAVALGGSLLRDLILDQPPVVVWSSWYLLVAGLTALVGMAVGPLLRRAEWVVIVLDAVVIGTFGVIATTKALSLGVGVVGALVVGIIGAVGGSLVRDLLLGMPVSFLQVGSLFAAAAGSGSALLILLVALGVAVPIAGVIALVVTAVVRLAAVRFDWRFPEQRALPWGRAAQDRRRGPTGPEPTTTV